MAAASGGKGQWGQIRAGQSRAGQQVIAARTSAAEPQEQPVCSNLLFARAVALLRARLPRTLRAEQTLADRSARCGVCRASTAQSTTGSQLPSAPADVIHSFIPALVFSPALLPPSTIAWYECQPLTCTCVQEGRAYRPPLWLSQQGAGTGLERCACVSCSSAGVPDACSCSQAGSDEHGGRAGQRHPHDRVTLAALS